jgi:putative ABC transport system permease protein
VLRLDKMAVARKRQRLMVDRYFVWILPVILIASTLWIALLLVLNVQQRREEIGILRALGHGSSRIAGLFVGKAAALGLIASALGFLLGTVLAHLVGPSIFGTVAGQVRTHWLLLPIVAVLAPLFAVVAALVPAMLAVVQDPAVTLRDDR